VDESNVEAARFRLNRSEHNGGFARTRYTGTDREWMYRDGVADQAEARVVVQPES